MPRIVSIRLSSCVSFWLALLAASLCFAQGAESTSSSFVLASASTGHVRFTALGETHQLRLEIFSAAGEKLFDSGLKSGGVLDWSLLDQRGQRLAEGAYRGVMTIRSRKGLSEQKWGVVVLRNGRFSLLTPEQYAQVNQAANSQPAINRKDSWIIVGEATNLPLVNPALGEMLQSTATIASSRDVITGVTAGTGLTGGGTSGDITLSLDQKFTDGLYVKKAGDTMTGKLNLPEEGLVVGQNRLVFSGSFVGLGITDPASKLDLLGRSSSGGVTITGTRVNGDSSLPTPVAFGNRLLGLEGRGFNDKSFTAPRVAIHFVAAETWNPESNGALMLFGTTPKGSTRGQTRMIINDDGNVGIFGADSEGFLPLNLLTVNGNASFGAMAANAGPEPIEVQGAKAGISLWDRTGGAVQRWVIYSDRDVHGNQLFRIHNPNLGTQGIDVFTMNLVGSATFNGVLAAGLGFSGKCYTSSGGPWDGNCNQDLAETFATREQTEPGDVVTLIPGDDAKPAVRKSLGSYDDHLIGVVSTNPGLVFDEGKTKIAGANDQLVTKDKAPIAAVGRVPVRFTLENGAIQVGDPLTSSSTVPGAAMKATQAGKIIGYALESSAKGKDRKLLMWIQVGYYVPAQSLARIRNAEAGGQEVTALKEQNQTLQQRIAELEAHFIVLEHAMQQVKGRQ